MSLRIYCDVEAGRGASRIAYEGVVVCSSQALPLTPGTRVVIKVLNAACYNQGVRLSMQDYKAQHRAQLLAEVFTQRRTLTVGGQIFAVLFQTTYLWNFAYEHRNRFGTLVINKGEEGLVEAKMFGSYTKFNSNSGYSTGCPEADFFSHWTLWYTNGTELVCDLQGIVSHGEGTLTYGSWFFTYFLFLTDPAILSVSKEWGPTDLGARGIAQWMALHQCNHLCRRFGLAKYTSRRNKPLRPVVRCTVAYYREPGRKKKACTLL